jgi:hypothetical protein
VKLDNNSLNIYRWVCSNRVQRSLMGSLLPCASSRVRCESLACACLAGAVANCDLSCGIRHLRHANVLQCIDSNAEYCHSTNRLSLVATVGCHMLTCLAACTSCTASSDSYQAVQLQRAVVNVLEQPLLGSAGHFCALRTGLATHTCAALMFRDLQETASAAPWRAQPVSSPYRPQRRTPPASYASK